MMALHMVGSSSRLHPCTQGRHHALPIRVLRGRQGCCLRHGPQSRPRDSLHLLPRQPQSPHGPGRRYCRRPGQRERREKVAARFGTVRNGSGPLGKAAVAAGDPLPHLHNNRAARPVSASPSTLQSSQRNTFNTKGSLCQSSSQDS